MFDATNRITMIETPAQRLKLARERAGFKTAADFARRYDLPESTYRSHDNGTRGLPIAAAKRYARLLPGVTWSYLVNGDEPPKGRNAGIAEANSQPQKIGAGAPIEVMEYDVRVPAGGGFHIDEETKRDLWLFSRRYLADELRLPTSKLVVMEVVGDSMSPTLESGDRVLVNLADKRVSQPGIFVLWDGDGTVVKRLELVPGTKPLRIKRISDNALHTTYEVLAEETNIIGRVVWIARRM